MSRGDQIDERLTLAHYRRLILLGKVALPLEEARRLVGPDCAYHLYFRYAGEGPPEPSDTRRHKPKRRGHRHK